MTSTTIDHLLTQIPDEWVASFCSGDRRGFGARGSSTDPGVMRIVAARTQPDIGFRFCKFCADHGITPDLTDPEGEPLWGAWIYCVNPSIPNPVFQRAMAFMTPEMAGMRATLKGMLLASDATHEIVAARLGQDPAVVRSFEVLFFNVLNRKDDVLYRQHLLYPDSHGRLEELNSGYLRSLPRELAVMRAGAKNGMDDAMFWSGASSKALEDLAGIDCGPELAKQTISYGLMLARNGGLNQGRRDASGLAAARDLARSNAKRPEQSEEQAMFDLRMNTALRDEIKALQIPIKFRDDRPPETES